MCRILVVYGTTEGHTAKIAHAIKRRLLFHGHEVDVANAATSEPYPMSYSGVMVAASVHAGRYQDEIVRWVFDHAPVLNTSTTAFVSVCLGVLQHDPKVDRELQAIVDAFLKTTSWHPSQTICVAGALKYTRYNLLVRWWMKRIARKAGGATDTSRDYEYTDWAALDEFVDRFSHRFETARRQHAV
jgi:menaquinone-dependent protoporphyrinogen oxidase